MELIVIAIVALVVMALVAAVMVAKSRKTDKIPTDAAESFSRTDLLNRSEKTVLAALDAAVPDVFGPDARIFAQVSLGEFLTGSTRSAHAKINQKRADFVIAAPAEKVVCVVEYQGAGHYGRSQASRDKAEASDRTKRAALASAGISMIEIPAKFTQDSVRAQLEAIAN